jgi:maleate isomerase
VDALTGVVTAGRRGVGVIVPYDFALDREVWRWAPEVVDLYLTRTRNLPLRADSEMARQISTDDTLRIGTQDLVAVAPEVVLYLCTSGSFVRGVEGERRMCAVMRDAGAPAAVTTSGALLDALAYLDVRTVAVASPYVPDVAAHLDAYLRAAGINVLAHRRLGLDEHIWQVPRRAVRELVLTADDAAAEAVFVSCTNVPTYELIAELEDLLGKPVLSANQVSMWAALREAGATPPSTRQRLFAHPCRSDALLQESHVHATPLRESGFPATS